MWRILISSIVACVLLGQAPTVDAATNDEKRIQISFMKAIQAKKTSKALRLIQRLTRRYPKSGMNWFNLGNTYFLVKRYQSAIKAYEKVIQLKSPLAPAAQLYIARSHRQRRRFLKATYALEKINSKKLPKGLKLEWREEKNILADKMLNRALKLYNKESYDDSLDYLMASHRMRKSSKALLMAGLIAKKMNYRKTSFRLMQRSMSFAQTRSDRTLIVRAARSIKSSRQNIWEKAISIDSAYKAENQSYEDDTLSESNDRTGLYLSSTYHYPIAKSKKLKYFGRISLTWDEVFENTEERYQSYNLDLIRQSSFGHSVFTIKPAWTHEFLGSTTYALKPSISSGYTYTGWPIHFGLEASYVHIDSGAEEFDFVHGQSQSGHFFLSTDLSNGYIKLGYTAESNDTKDSISGTTLLPLANTTTGPSIIYFHQWSKGTSLQMKLSQLTSEFWKPSLPSNIERSDETLTASALLKKPFSAGLQGYLSLEYLENSSTMETSTGFNKNYSQLTAYVGAFWTIKL